MKLARWVTGRQKVVARYRSSHGATAGAAALTGDPRRWPAEPAAPGVVRMFDPYPYRCSAGHSYDALGVHAFDPTAGHVDDCAIAAGGPRLEEILQFEGPGSVAAVILRP